MKKLLNVKTAVAAALATAGTSAFAAIDVAAAVTEIQGNSASVEAIGVAVIAVCAVVLGIKLIKRVM